MSSNIKNTHTFSINVNESKGLIAIQCLKCDKYFNFVDGKYSKWNYKLSCDELIIREIIE